MNQKILDSLNDVNEQYIEEAAPRRSRKKTHMRWVALAACLCLAVAGIWAHGHLQKKPEPQVDVSGLPEITVPSLSVNAGFEGLLYYKASEIRNGNPWNEKVSIETLPVFRNECYDASNTGLPTGLTEEEMAARLEVEAAALKLTIQDLKRETNAQKDEEGHVKEGDQVLRLIALTDQGKLEVSGDGTVTYLLPEGSRLPDAYHFTYSETTDEEAQAVMEYLVETYADVLDMQDPQIILGGDYAFDGSYYRTYEVYEGAEDPEQAILNYGFRRVEFAPDDAGNLMLIRIYDRLCKAEKIDDYPIISVREATERLLNGQYQSSVPVSMPGKKAIAKVELVYRSGPLEETLLPYYRFYLELPDEDGWTMHQENGLKTFGAYYVPALPEAVISNFSTYNGRFN